jgi:ketosteroid isomerase-like protein
MSEQNVEVVRRWYASFSDPFGATPDEYRERFDEALRDYGDEQFEARLDPDYPEGEQVFRGREGAIQLLTMMRDVWGVSFGLNRNASSTQGIGWSCSSASWPKVASGVPIELKTAHVWTVREGRSTSVRFYRDRSKALEAAGLRE